MHSRRNGDPQVIFCPHLLNSHLRVFAQEGQSLSGLKNWNFSDMLTHEGWLKITNLTPLSSIEYLSRLHYTTCYYVTDYIVWIIYQRPILMVATKLAVLMCTCCARKNSVWKRPTCWRICTIGKNREHPRRRKWQRRTQAQHHDRSTPQRRYITPLPHSHLQCETRRACSVSVSLSNTDGWYMTI